MFVFSIYAPKNILNDEQLDAFMDAIRNEPLWYDFFYTEITTGLRRGEICALKWIDLDDTTGKLKVQRTVHSVKGDKLEIGETKTEKGTRSILLPPSTLHLLKERRKTAITEWIFPSLLTPEKPTSPNAAYQRLKVILAEAGLPDIRFSRFPAYLCYNSAGTRHGHQNTVGDYRARFIGDYD